VKYEDSEVLVNADRATYTNSQTNRDHSGTTEQAQRPSRPTTAFQRDLQHVSGKRPPSPAQGEGRLESAATQQPWKQQEWGGTERRREQQRRRQQQKLSGILGGLCSRIPDPSRCLHFMTVLAEARPAALLAPTSDAMDVAGKLPTVSASCREFTKEPTTSGEPLHTLHVAF
jgi:hypothetical protein